MVVSHHQDNYNCNSSRYDYDTTVIIVYVLLLSHILVLRSSYMFHKFFYINIKSILV